MISPFLNDVSIWTLSYHMDNKEPSLLSNTLLEKKQLFANSCGACALLVAAKELGVDNIPMLPGLYSELTGGRLELTNECESDLYRITSGSTLYRLQCSDLSNAGYSMPQGIALACRMLGIDCYISENKSVFSKSLSWLYPEVKKQCEGMGVQVREEMQEDTERFRLKAMAVSIVGIPVGLHWVLCRPDGSFMDPGVGKNSLNFNELVRNARKDVGVCGYYDTGISIILGL
ncbi:hypothetical protein [Salmonella bongori]|uniref:hypothetical protein n=1 Tax=Salmonella bongori TaxID=54736 RepID=UPI0023D8BA6C|nr:hypothetical protein [Salmonella bongori]